MNKRELHHYYTQLRKVPYWPLVAGLGVSGLTAGFALRANNQHMIVLRQAVFTADEKGTDLEKPLHDLREYVYAHMNTNLSSGTNPVKPPIQLKFTYERLAAAEKQRVSDITSKIYVDAEVECEREFPNGFSGSNRLPCIKNYVDTHGATAKAVPDALYKFDFQTPFWTPDLAGLSIVAFIGFALLLVIRLLSGLLIRKQLKKSHH